MEGSQNIYLFLALRRVSLFLGFLLISIYEHEKEVTLLGDSHLPDVAFVLSTWSSGNMEA